MRKTIAVVVMSLALGGCASVPTSNLEVPEVEGAEETVEAGDGESTETTGDYDPCEAGRLGSVWVLAEEDGCIDPWPLTSTSGILMCDPNGEGVGAVVWNPDEDPLEFYAVNGIAIGQGYPEIEPLWKDSPEGAESPKVNIGSLLDAGLDLCDS